MKAKTRSKSIVRYAVVGQGDIAMPRELWKGAIQFGLVHIPVSLHPAEQRDELSFTLLDRRDLQPVGYRRFNKATGDEVAFEETIKGYEVDEGAT